MANNKLWAVCKHDNEATVLLKNYCDWYCVGNEKDHNDFFQKHVDCKGQEGCGENIVFVRETGDDDRVAMFDFRYIYPDNRCRIYLKGQENRIPKSDNNK